MQGQWFLFLASAVVSCLGCSMYSLPSLPLFFFFLAQLMVNNPLRLQFTHSLLQKPFSDILIIFFITVCVLDCLHFFFALQHPSCIAVIAQSCIAFLLCPSLHSKSCVCSDCFLSIYVMGEGGTQAALNLNLRIN